MATIDGRIILQGLATVTRHVPTKGKGITFVRLPLELQRVIDGGCQCKRRGCDGMWDTLAVPHDGSTTWTVHHPDFREG